MQGWSPPQNKFVETLDVFEPPAEAAYAELVKCNFCLLDASNVGVDHLSPTMGITADKVVAGCNFHPSGVSGMARLVARVCSPGNDGASNVVSLPTSKLVCSEALCLLGEDCSDVTTPFDFEAAFLQNTPRLPNDLPKEVRSLHDTAAYLFSREKPPNILIVILRQCTVGTVVMRICATLQIPLSLRPFAAFAVFSRRLFRPMRLRFSLSFPAISPEKQGPCMIRWRITFLREKIPNRLIVVLQQSMGGMVAMWP